MSSRWLYLVAVALLLALFHQQTCDAAVTQAPPKGKAIEEQSAPVAEVEPKKQSVKKSNPEDPSAGPKDSMVVVDKGAPAPPAPAAPGAPAAPAAAAAPSAPAAPSGPQAEAKAPEPVHGTGSLSEDDVHVEHRTPDMDFPGQAVVYILVGITSTAILLLVMRVYRLRLSRAERKYGVQGDRANQELTPLPMAIEDVNSDEEDHTLFELVQV
ncbi:translation initiation factor IF-2 isoform X2 [Drosophila subpulchrella]|uniref:translation initiation factor IF-2 isoform X2 n=1 Tax=Drosophila subpulchrella TaxID=1486046 RepID=UPI0018A1A79D|nr:translation initiation factor IF-2 isoform X2 [Drosophila subpulchrella]